MTIYCFDLDDTICFPQHQFTDSERKYAQAAPNVTVIAKIKDLHREGNEIIIFTARRMLTHKGNIEKIKLDVEQVTKDWLSEYHVPFHQLIFGKPYADYYIDDKAVPLDRLQKIDT